MKRRILPIGFQAFRDVREMGCYYIDKTQFIRTLYDSGKHYFLSRPRRFGKSLFLDTLKELFEGSEALFRGLHIHSRWDWSVRHPVVRLDFASGGFEDPGYLSRRLADQLGAIERAQSVGRHSQTAAGRFEDLIEALHRRTGRRVAVLVDEYDKPVLDALVAPEVARANRDYLRGLYATIKSSDAHIRFTFITGVSKFSKVSLFSGLNNLEDITLDPRYSSICGYTETDLDKVFAPELPGLDREEIRRWYNGYSWLGEERVYNPFDILLLFKKRRFKAHWIETGTPSFLLDLLTQRRIGALDLERMTGDEELLSKFDVGDISTEALLFQTGYLTITGHEDLGGEPQYRLGYPNREVRQSVNRWLLGRMVADPSERAENLSDLQRVMRTGDPRGLERVFRAIFDGIPYEWHAGVDVGRYETYYATVLYTYFAALGFDLTVEDSSRCGRADMTVRFEGGIYLFEFKVAGSPGAAVKQIKDTDYAGKYLGRSRPVWLVGMKFSIEDRNVERFEVERLQ